mmetsp:Transcript_81264/g.161251  ORF Transcript_81264/g.161251 Transcript_81264/m.161251 type:complete len:435 (-) Transcript_81264:66-1370(-)
MSVTIAAMISLLVLFRFFWHVTGDRNSGSQAEYLSLMGELVGKDPTVELVLKKIESATDVEELLELCAIEQLRAARSSWLLDPCRKTLRDLMLVLRKATISNRDVSWKFVAAGVHCVAEVSTMSVGTGNLEDASREAKQKCADFCQGQAGFTLFLGSDSVECSCCSSMSSQSSDGGDRSRQYRLVSTTGVQPSRGRVQRLDSDICHADELQSMSLGSVRFLNRQRTPVEVSMGSATPPAFFRCPHLCIENAAVTSWLYTENDLMVWMYPAGTDPVYCRDSKGHFYTSVWSYYPTDQPAVVDVSVCHKESFYPLPMLKASKRANNIFVDDVATYGHVEWDGQVEKGVCKKLFLGALDAAENLMNPLVVELSFTAQPTDKGCGCYAGAFFAKFKAFSLTIGGVSFDICNAAELTQICGSGDLLGGQWSMRPIQACS